MSNGVTAWSYSRYADYARCPKFFFEKHIAKNPRLKFETSPAMERGSQIHKKGEMFLTTPKMKLPPEYGHFKGEMAQLKGLDPLVEQQWGFDANWQAINGGPRDPNGWFAPTTWLRIVTDVTVVYDDQTADVIDFKTGRKYETNKDQMDLFACGPFMKFPGLQAATTRLWYLDQPTDNEVVAEYTRADFERIKKQWAKKIVPMFQDKKFPPKANEKCRYCALGMSKGGDCKFG